MPRTPDMFSGWFDNQSTQQREHWDNGVRGRFAHRRCIETSNPWPELRPAWGTNPDLPTNAGAPATA
ncbi:hypothetical protein L2Y96_18175 [Luteibacter aegosomaticola]|uniref:hypothetical protein n=1 Tax=Luteibacter aegosomaticola TaxID=2911538 RepID=UPI001FFBCB43|nr:hypothetical protein [Luteibacter aegosomaticola]UPG89306.1 hypothetical protein L2Y96_18175 [Luteibacter aegosomaticola]